MKKGERKRDKLAAGEREERGGEAEERPLLSSRRRAISLTKPLPGLPSSRGDEREEDPKREDEERGRGGREGEDDEEEEDKDGGETREMGASRIGGARFGTGMLIL